MIVSVPLFHVVDGRFFASAEVKSYLDGYLAEMGEPPLPIEIIWPTEQPADPTAFPIWRASSN